MRGTATFLLHALGAGLGFGPGGPLSGLLGVPILTKAHRPFGHHSYGRRRIFKRSATRRARSAARRRARLATVRRRRRRQRRAA